MIIVNMPLKREHVKALILNIQDEHHAFQFIKEAGIKLYFEDTKGDEVEGMKLIKSTIKEDLGGGFYFNVEVTK